MITINPNIAGIDFSAPGMAVLVSGVLIASTTIPFVLSSVSTNLRMGTTRMYGAGQTIFRIAIILLFMPFLLFLFIGGFALFCLVSLAYAGLAGWASSHLPMIDKPFVEKWVFFFMAAECLYYAYKHSLYEWFLSKSENTSISMAEEQYEVVYAESEGGKFSADLVKSTIRVSALNMIVVLFWAALKFSNIMTMPWEISYAPTIASALIFSILPFAMIWLLSHKPQNLIQDRK